MIAEIALLKIDEVYSLICSRYSNVPNTIKNRLLLKTDLMFELGHLATIKCDEENNPPDVSELDCLVGTVFIKTNSPSFKYSNLIFGKESNFSKVRLLRNL